MSTFCYGEQEMRRQEGQWSAHLKRVPSPVEEVLSFARRGRDSFASAYMAYRAFAILLTPDYRVFPFYVPERMPLFGERPLDEFRGLFAPGMKQYLVSFATQVLVCSHKEARALGLFDAGHVARYEILFEDAMRVVPLGTSLAALLQKQHENNALYKQAFITA